MSWRDGTSALAALVASLLGGYAGARLPEREPVRRPQSAPTVMAERSPEVPRCAAAASGAPAVLDEAARRALVSEISAAVAAELRAAREAARPPAPPPSPEELAAGAEAARLLERALRAGVWTDGDAEAAQRLLPQLGPEDTGALMRGLAAAMNRGDLAVRTRGPPM